MEDPAYPQKLKQIPDPPLGLYVKGRLPSQEQKTVAIVGARMCSEYGRAVAKELGDIIAKRGYPTVVNHRDMNRDNNRG